MLSCMKLTQLIQQAQQHVKQTNLKEERYYQTRKIKTCKPRCLMKLNQVLSSDRVYPIHGVSWHRKSLCLELVFVFSLNSATKSLHLTIVILQQNKKGETMTGQRIGYIRVSAVDQNTESQKAILAKLGIDKYFEEKVSGKNTTAANFKICLIMQGKAIQFALKTYRG